MKKGDIFREMKHLGINHRFVDRTLKRFIVTGSTKNKPKSGRKQSVRTPETIKIIRERVRRNCDRSARKMVANQHVNRECVRKILKDHSVQEKKNAWHNECWKN